MRAHEKTSPPTNPPSALVAPEALAENDGVTFQRERLAPILRELLPLIEADWRENGIDHDKVPLNLNIEKYLDYDTLGILQIVTARDQEADGALVGFVFAFVHPNIMHEGLGWAQINLYYLEKQYRGKGSGRAMVEVLLGFLVTAKVGVVEASEKIERAHGLFDRLGFKATDRVVRKYLED